MSNLKHYELFEKVQQKFGVEVNPHTVIYPHIMYGDNGLSHEAKLLYGIIFSNSDSELGYNDDSNTLLSTLLGSDVDKPLLELENGNFIKVEDRNSLDRKIWFNPHKTNKNG